MKDFDYKGYKYDTVKSEDGKVSCALFLFEKDGEEYYVESPSYCSNYSDYHNLKVGTPRVHLAIQKGMDIDEAFEKYYLKLTSWIED